MSNWIIIKNGRIIDPLTGRDETGDLYVADDRISATPPPDSETPEIIDASGLVVAPGLIDLHVHFREPGFEEAETISTGSEAAAAGGFTTVVTMPNTNPTTDSAENVKFILDEAVAAGKVKILPSGCITSKRAGNTTADFRGMKDAGAIAFTDDGSTVEDTKLLTESMISAAELGMPVMDHALLSELAGDGVIRECASAEKNNLPTIPASAEIEAVARDIELADQTGCHMHIQHLSTKESVDLIRTARKNGISVSTEATPHHLMLSVDDIDAGNANFKMNPPLGTADDVQALQQGIVDGTIQAFATDHAPHTAKAKSNGFVNGPFGIIGLETAIATTYTCLVASGMMTLQDWLSRWTTGPANIINITAPSLAPDSVADIVIMDLESEWLVDPQNFRSKSTNTPFAGTRLTGQAVYTICGGIITHKPSNA